MQDHDKFKKEAIKRVRIAEGHLRKVEEMLLSGEYCPDIIHQSRAVQAALKKADEVVLHGHLHHCVLKDMHGNGSEKTVQEIMELFRKKD